MKKKFKRRLRKLANCGRSNREIIQLVRDTNLGLAAKILGVSDVGLRKFLIRENLYASCRTVRKPNRRHARPVVHAYKHSSPEHLEPMVLTDTKCA